VTKVSVIVPVYNPGDRLEACIDSLLGQTMPAADVELIFVDDGSTDASPERLDRLAAEHDHVRVEHMPNSGWPGRPRNRGIELATGDFVYFVDNDDWLDAAALERLYEMALLDEADIVIGKVVGHGKSSARLLFRENLHGVRLEDHASLLLKLLTPHKLFRRSLLDEHGIRFPEGRRRLEDHVFVVEAYFRADRISVLADHPCYHWVFHDSEANASHQRIDAGYFDNVREVLDLVERHTEPGELREEMLLHWYRNKMLKRVGGPSFAKWDPEYQRGLYEPIRELALERWGDDVHDRLPLGLRIRSRLLRSGTLESLLALSEAEQRLSSRISVEKLTAPGTHLTLRVTGRLDGDSPLLAFVRRGERIEWDPPAELRGALGDDGLDVTSLLRRSTLQLYLHRVQDGLQYAIPANTRVKLDEEEPGRVTPVVTATASIAPTIAAGGAPLPAGEWHVYATVAVAGHSSTGQLTRRGEPLVLTTRPPGRIAEGANSIRPASLKRRLRARLPWLAGALRRTRGAAGAGARG
jgi:glycosyltransferase involved in cell wall biosynthesis